MEAIYNAATGLDLKPSTKEDSSMLDRIAKETVDRRRYRLSDKITPGIGYDDRLEQRLGLSKNTIKKYVDNGRLQAIKLDGKILASERAVMRFLDPMGYAAKNEASTSQAA